MANIIGFHFLGSPASKSKNRLTCATWFGLPLALPGPMEGRSALIFPSDPGTETAQDDALRLSRNTSWQEAAPECFLGLGQRVFTTSGGEYPLLECRAIELTQSS